MLAIAKRIAFACLLLSPTAGIHAAELKLASIFSDHMVLQREMKVNVWGWADPGQTVEVQCAGQKRVATVEPSGKWILQLDPLQTSDQPQELIVTAGAATLKRSDVLVGEVWLCSGQSNMEWALARSTGGPDAVEHSDNPMLRLRTIPHNSQLSPQDDVSTKWVQSGPNVTGTFSAIAWWFGSKLQKELRVPVGIINDSFGGTSIESWIPLETLKQGPWPQDQHTDITLAKANYDLRKAKMQPVMDKYLQDKALAIKEKRQPPDFPSGWPGDFRGPSVLWNGMVAPLRKLSIRGVLWYQGESNAYPGVANTYKLLLPALIKDWRSGFEQPELPFIIYQIAPNRKPQTDPNENSGIAVIQEAELKTSLATPRTALVVTMDLGETNVHYPNKEPAAERGMKAALGIAYGRQVEDSSPTFNSLQIQGNEAVVHFNHTDGGLATNGGAVSGFAIAGEDRNFFFADARIEGDTVIVSSPRVLHPVAVRYGWADFPKVNLFSKAGLPASPFRSDDWPPSMRP